MVPVQSCDSLVCVLCSDWFFGSCVMFSLGAFDLMQRCADRSNSDLKQCMPVRNLVRLEPAPTPCHCHVWHQSTAIAFREQPAHSAGTVSPERLQER